MTDALDYDPTIAYCTADGCHELAVTENLDGMCNGVEVVDLVCYDHKDRP